MIKEIPIDNTEEWDGLVKKFHDYDVYYLSCYVKAFMLHGDGTPMLFYYEDNKIKAINVVMLRDVEKDENFTRKIPSNTYFDITTPYGYGGFLVEGNIDENSLKLLENEYSSYCISKGIISEFVRFHPVLHNSGVLKNIYETTELGKSIAIKLNSKELIWNNLISKNRNMVRKSLKLGVEIFCGRSKELFELFIPLYNSTMDKDKANQYYYFNDNFYKSILFDCKYNSMIFYAVYRDKIIAMSIVLLANGRMNYHLSASDKEYQHLAATNLLLYEAACWGSENGFTTFHLGGGLGSIEDSLYKFKSSFNRNSNYAFVIGKKIFDKEKYEELVEIRKNKKLNSPCDDSTINNSTNSFFPEYRDVNI